MKLLVFLLLSFGLYGRIYAQEKTQLIHGLITDPDLKAVAGMQVSLYSNGAYNQYTKTDSNGYFSLYTNDTGNVKLHFYKQQHSFTSHMFSLCKDEKLLLNVRYKGQPEIRLRYIGQTIPELITEVYLLNEVPLPTIGDEIPRNTLYPASLHHRDAEMILRNWQMGASGNLHLNLRPLNPNQ